MRKKKDDFELSSGRFDSEEMRRRKEALHTLVHEVPGPEGDWWSLALICFDAGHFSQQGPSSANSHNRNIIH